MKVGLRDAIKAIQVPPVKNLKRKSVVVESSDSDSKTLAKPKPSKNQKSKARTIESDDDLPAPPKRAVKPALTNKGDVSEEDSHPKKGAKKNKGKGKEIQQPDKKGKATDKDPDQPRDGNVPIAKKSVLFLWFLSCPQAVTCHYFC